MLIIDKLDDDDVLTVYFVMIPGSGRYNYDSKTIVAYTDSKKLLQFYLDFHKCKSFTVKSKTATKKALMDIINEAPNDDIKIMFIKIINNDSKHPKMENIYVPITEEERSAMQSDIDTYCSTWVNYTLVNEMVYYLKDKYTKPLKDLLLFDVLRSVLENQVTERLKKCKLDELKVLSTMFEERFK